MASHVRKQIRDRAVTVLTGLDTTGDRVFASRFRELDESDLPALLIFTGDEDIEVSTIKGGGAARQARSCSLVVWAVAQDREDLDDQIDTIIAEVETALFADWTDTAGSFGDLCKTLDLTSIETDFTDGARQPLGHARIEFTAEYHTAEGAPTATV